MTVHLAYDIPKDQHPAIVLGEDKSFPRGVAINMLPESEVDDKVGLLWAVLQNEDDNPNYRQLAAANLWRMNTPEAHEYLLKAAETVKHPDVLAAVVKYLGRVGGENALKLIEEIQRGADGFLAAQAGFAASLISYRLGLPGHDLPIPDKYIDMPPGGNVGLDFTKAPAKEIEMLAASLASEPYGIDIMTEMLLSYACPGGPGMLVFNKALGRGEAAALVQKQKTLMGLLTNQNSEDGRYSVSSLILSSPNEQMGYTDLFIYRVTGRPAWAGTAKPVAGDQVDFEIRTPESVGIVPLELAGTLYNDGSVAIHHAVSAGRVLQKREPIPMQR